MYEITEQYWLWFIHHNAISLISTQIHFMYSHIYHTLIYCWHCFLYLMMTEFRLVNGSYKNVGRPEVYFKGFWSTIDMDCGGEVQSYVMYNILNEKSDLLYSHITLLFMWCNTPRCKPLSEVQTQESCLSSTEVS